MLKVPKHSGIARNEENIQDDKAHLTTTLNIKQGRTLGVEGRQKPEGV